MSTDRIHSHPCRQGGSEIDRSIREIAARAHAARWQLGDIRDAILVCRRHRLDAGGRPSFGSRSERQFGPTSIRLFAVWHAADGNEPTVDRSLTSGLD